MEIENSTTNFQGQSDPFSFNKETDGFAFATIKRPAGRKTTTTTVANNHQYVSHKISNSLSNTKKKSVIQTINEDALTNEQKSSKDASKQETFGWQPEESVAIYQETALNKSSSNKNHANSSYSNKNDGWKPEESVALNIYGDHFNSSKQNNHKLEEKKNEWAVEESVQIKTGQSYNKNKSAPRDQEPEKKNEWVVEDSIQIGNNGLNYNKNPDNKQNSGWIVENSIEVNNNRRISTNIEKKNEWTVEESLQVNNNGRTEKSHNSHNKNNYNKTEEKKNEWVVEESIQVKNEKTEKSVNNKNKSGWVVEDSIAVNPTGNNENKKIGMKLNESNSTHNWGRYPSDKSKISVASPMFPDLDSNNTSKRNKKYIEEIEENKNDNTWGEIESVEVLKKKEKTQLLSRSNKKDETFNDFCATSVVVGNKQLPKQSSNYTLPDVFFSKKEKRTMNWGGKIRMSLLNENLSLNIESFKLLYNKENVVKMVKLPEEVKIKLKMPSMTNNNGKTKKPVIPQAQSKQEDKGVKGGKISKIMKMNNRVCILIHDIKENISKTIFLFNTNVMPSRFHCWDQYLGYFYVYDNNGKISVYIGNIKDEWGDERKDDRRKLCELTLPNDILNPILYLLKLSRDESLLLVIGGYKEIYNKIFPIDKIFVFYLSFSGGYVGSTATAPLMQIKMKYGRISPLVCKQNYGKEKYLLIIGGNNIKKIKKKHLFNPASFDNFKNSLEMGESISIKNIKENIFQIKITKQIKEISMDNSLKIESSRKNLKKMYSFSQGAVIRIKTGKVGEKEGKTNFFIGVGTSKRSVYILDYLDYAHCCLNITKAFTKYVQTGLICSEMAYFHQKTLFYLVEDYTDKGYKTVTIDFGEDNHNKTTKCVIF